MTFSSTYRPFIISERFFPYLYTHVLTIYIEDAKTSRTCQLFEHLKKRPSQSLNSHYSLSIAENKNSYPKKITCHSLNLL
jgi:hypothetical protein